MDTKKTVSRREFLKVAGITVGAASLAACTPQVVTVTQIVKETQIQTQMATSIVKETSIVEVTPTLAPAIVTPQGRTLPLDAAPLEKQIFTSDYGIEPKFFDGVRDIYSQAGLLAINETLIHNDANMETVPSLAESWKAGPETRYWEFTIQEGAIWSDGSPITSDDVVYTYVHLADPIVQNPWMWFFGPIKGLTAYNSGKFSQSVIDDPKTGGVRKVDDRTFRIYGEGPDADGDPIPFLPALLSYQASVIVPKKLVEKDPLHWADTGVGLISGGPYLCTAWDHSVSITYDTNPKYNRPMKPAIQHMITPIGIANIMAAWLNQEVDLIHSLGAPAVAQIRADPRLNPLMHFFPWFQTVFLMLNTFMPPLDNPKVRMALAKSIDRDTFCNSISLGLASPAFSMLMEGFPAYNPDLAPIQAYDVEAAKTILADAGYKDGKDASGKQLTLTITDAGVSASLVYVKQQWETNLGIKVDLKANEGGVWGTARVNHTMQVAIWGYEYDYVDPYNLIGMLYHSNANAAASHNKPIEEWGAAQYPWYNAAFDKKCDQAGLEPDPAKRIELFKEAEKILVEDAPVVFMTHQIMFQIWWPWLKGMQPDKKGNVAYRFLDISQFQMYISADVDELKAQYKDIM